MITTAPQFSSYRRLRIALTEVLISVIVLVAGTRSSSADVTINFSGFSDGQLIPVYQSQGWDVGSEAWYMGGSGGPYNDAYEFRTIAAGGPFYTGVDGIYAPYGQAWFVQIHTGLSFVPDGDTITIAGLGTGETTSIEVVGFDGDSKVLDETISTTLAFPGTTTIQVSDPSLTPVTSLEFAPVGPLNYQITSLDVGTISLTAVVPELATWVSVMWALGFSTALGVFRSIRSPKKGSAE